MRNQFLQKPHCHVPLKGLLVYGRPWNSLTNGFGLAVPLEMLRGRQELQQPGHLENSPQGRNLAPLLKETFSGDLCMEKLTVNIMVIL
jgi:hypothetical protein